MALTTRYGYADTPTPGDPQTAWTTVNTGGIASGATSLPIVSAASFPSSVEYDIVVGLLVADGTLTNAELMHVTTGGASPWTVVRTVATAHAATEKIYHVISADGLKYNPGVMTDTGDLQYLGSDGRPARLAVGTANYVLGSDGTTPVYSITTGSGSVVRATSPTLVTPLLGTPTSGNLVNCTGYTAANLAGLGAGVGTFLTTPSSANLAAALTDESGSGAVMFVRRPYTAQTSAYPIVAATDYCINCTANSFAVTLPTAVGITGQEFQIKNSGVGVITINTTAAQTVDGNASGVLTLNQYDNLTVLSNGANWIIL